MKAIGTPTVALVVSVVLLVTAAGYVSYGLTSTNQSATQPCETSAGLAMPGVSVVTSNGVQKCVVGPPIVTYPDGRVDFRNGTVINLHANLTGAAVIGQGGSGGRNDTVILPNGTRFTFNSRGIIVTISPYQGRAVYSNGVVVDIPACQYPIDPNLQLAHGVSANGTAWWTSADGQAVSFYPDGTCSG